MSPCVLRVCLQHKRKERIMLLNRKGFVKIAVESGLDGGIIPVYHYGNTQVGVCADNMCLYYSSRYGCRCRSVRVTYTHSLRSEQVFVLESCWRAWSTGMACSCGLCC